jgi:hypothetical protein
MRGRSALQVDELTKGVDVLNGARRAGASVVTPSAPQPSA